MSARDSLNPEGSLWDLISVQLRRHREERKLSGTALAVLFDLDRSSVSRLESGGMKLQQKHARIADREWGTGGLFACLVGFARAGHDVEWFKAHEELETRADELRIWELAWIPGLFQTEAYTRAAFEAMGYEDVDKHVAARMQRQEALSRRPWPVIRVLLDQNAIEHPVGGPKIMREQLTRLLELAQLPNVAIRIAPRGVGAHPGRDGSFKIMSANSTEAVYTEACGGGRLTVDATDVRRFRRWFDRISDRALPVDASIELIKQVMEDMQ